MDSSPDIIDQLFHLLLLINSKYAPISSRSHNLTYLSRLSLLSDDTVRTKTTVSICADGISAMLRALDIGRISPLFYKKLSTIVNNINTKYKPLAESF